MTHLSLFLPAFSLLSRFSIFASTLLIVCAAYAQVDKPLVLVVPFPLVVALILPHVRFKLNYPSGLANQ